MNDPHAVSAAFLAQRHDLLAFIRALTGDAALAEDVLQDCWVALAEATAQGRAIDNLAAWTRSVAKHAVLRHWRKAGRERPAGDAIAELIEQGFGETTLEPAGWTARIEALRACLGSLQAAVRRLVEARYHAGQSPEAIAAAEGATIDAVAMRLSRARQALRACVERRLGSER